MKNKIPPPVVTLISGLIIFFSKPLFPDQIYYLTNAFSLAFLILGFLVLFLALISFKKHNTTVNPLQPSKASSLVKSGIFSYSRNPMYLGMLFILISISIKFNFFGGLIVIPLFIIFITMYQIKPEEDAMHILFDNEFKDYKKQTRRWF